MRRAGAGRLIAGIAAAGAGIAALVVGGILLNVEQVKQVDHVDGRGLIPGTTTLTTERAEYAVVLGKRFVSANLINDARCSVRGEDGSRSELDASVQGVSVDFEAATIGSFDASPGRTTISCRWGDGDSIPVRPILVAKAQEGLRTGAYVAFGVGTLLLVLGGVLVLLAVRARANDMTF